MRAFASVVMTAIARSFAEQTLVLQLDLLAQAQGQIALGLIQTYRALGGGWELGH
jgi:outer membrane protein TolC